MVCRSIRRRSSVRRYAMAPPHAELREAVSENTGHFDEDASPAAKTTVCSPISRRAKPSQDERPLLLCRLPSPPASSPDLIKVRALAVARHRGPRTSRTFDHFHQVSAINFICPPLISCIGLATGRMRFEGDMTRKTSQRR